MPAVAAGIIQVEWARDFQVAYGKLCAMLDLGEPIDINEYACKNPAEFFAVLSEAFFLTPTAVQSNFPAVYRQLAAFYRQDPLVVMTEATDGG